LRHRIRYAWKKLCAIKNPVTLTKELSLADKSTEQSLKEKSDSVVDEVDEPSAKRVKEDDQPEAEIIEEAAAELQHHKSDDMVESSLAEVKENEEHAVNAAVEADESFSMEEAEALSWKSYFLCACRWFDINQDQELRFDQLQMILLASQR
jgi:hypothetical protein